MVENAQSTYEAVCPHCKRDFVAELLEGSSAHHRGFKCPHCKLFVPLERAEEPAPAESA
jgi:transposase-like protein